MSLNNRQLLTMKKNLIVVVLMSLRLEFDIFVIL